MKAQSWLGLLPALLVCLSTGALLWQANSTQSVAALDFAEPAQPCIAAPSIGDWQVGYPDDGASAVRQEDGWHLRGRAWLTGKVCGPGTLKISGFGDEAQDETGERLPRLQVSLDGKKLANEAFSQQGGHINVKVPHAGQLTLAYLNDHYESEYRLAVLENVTLEDATCTDPVTAQVSNAAQWDAETSTATTFNDPFTLSVCGAGTLIMKAWGLEAQQAAPHVRLEQDGKVLQELTLPVKEKRQSLRLPVNAGEVTVTLTNPYSQQLADRNLYLREVTFKPQ